MKSDIPVAPHPRKARTTDGTRLALMLSVSMVSSLTSQAALAQDPPTEGTRLLMREQNVMFETARPAIMSGIGSVGVLANAASVMGEVVTGKPYSADAMTESVQVLADGNRIVNTTHTRLYRDSEGRTRREQMFVSGGQAPLDGALTLIVIDDPVANVSYVLDVATRTARQLRPLQFAQARVAGSVGAAGNLAERNIVIARRALPPQEGVEPSSGSDEALAPPRFEIGLSSPALTMPMVNMRALMTPLSAASSEDLGEQVLEGVLAEGVREIQTIAAGEIGNELPIEVVAERWYSPELEAIVLRETYDPRFGNTSYRLVNVDRSEPPPELFTVPQDYRLESLAPPTPPPSP